MVTKLKGYNEIEPTELELSPFKAIGKNWMEVVCGEPEGELGAMTASWGGLGFLWNKPVAFVVVRGADCRYTRHIIDEQPIFSLNFLGEGLQEAKNYLGRVHGWDVSDKIEGAGLSKGWCGVDLEHDPKIGIGKHVHTAFIEESDAVLICEKICSVELDEASFIDPQVWEQWYTKEGQHRLYIAEIRGAFVK